MIRRRSERGLGTTVPSSPLSTSDNTGQWRAHTYDLIDNRQAHTDVAGETVYKTTNRLNLTETMNAAR